MSRLWRETDSFLTCTWLFPLPKRGKKGATHFRCSTAKQAVQPLHIYYLFFTSRLHLKKEAPSVQWWCALCKMSNNQFDEKGRLRTFSEALQKCVSGVLTHRTTVWLNSWSFLTPQHQELEIDLTTTQIDLNAPLSPIGMAPSSTDPGPEVLASTSAAMNAAVAAAAAASSPKNRLVVKKHIDSLGEQDAASTSNTPLSPMPLKTMSKATIDTNPSDPFLLSSQSVSSRASTSTTKTVSLAASVAPVTVTSTTQGVLGDTLSMLDVPLTLKFENEKVWQSFLRFNWLSSDYDGCYSCYSHSILWQFSRQCLLFFGSFLVLHRLCSIFVHIGNHITFPKQAPDFFFRTQHRIFQLRPYTRSQKYNNKL